MKNLNLLIIFLFLFFGFKSAKGQGNVFFRQPATTSNNQIENPNQDKRTHKGFYMSFALGPSFSNITDNYTDSAYIPITVKFSGTGFKFEYQIGGAIIENLILHAAITSMAISGPTMNFSSSNPNIYFKTPTVKAPDQLTIGEAMFGGGVTYYFMPYNIFASTTLGLGNFTLIDDTKKTSFSTTRGFSYIIKVGKEWYVSRKWALGATIGYNSTYTSMSTKYGPESLNSSNFTIMFHAAFN